VSAGASGISDVILHFNGRGFRLACAPGEEARLEALAAAVKARLDTLIEEHGQVGDDRLLLMAALQFADEADDLRRALDAAERKSEARMPGKAEARTRKTAAAAVVPASSSPATLGSDRPE
jgi:cell division protein ZapA